MEEVVGEEDSVFGHEPADTQPSVETERQIRASLRASMVMLNNTEEILRTLLGSCAAQDTADIVEGLRCIGDIEANLRVAIQQSESREREAVPQIVE